MAGAAPADVDPVAEAAKTALRQRLAEVLRAENLQREAVSQQPRYATEPIAIEQEPEQQPQTAEQIIASSGLPERAQAWLRRHPDYVTDPQKNAHIQGLHYAAQHQAGGDAFSDMYFTKLEGLLGIRQAPQSNGNGAYQSTPPSVQRQAAPVRQQSRVPMSAPPHREAPSMSTGRAPQPMKLTAAELEIAAASGISPEKYAEKKQLMLKLKADGQIDDRR